VCRARGCVQTACRATAESDCLQALTDSFPCAPKCASNPTIVRRRSNRGVVACKPLQRQHVHGGSERCGEREAKLTERAALDARAARRASILSADFSRLGGRLDEVLAAGARVIQVPSDGRALSTDHVRASGVSAIADRVHGRRRADRRCTDDRASEGQIQHIAAAGGATASPIHFGPRTRALHAGSNPRGRRTAGVADLPETPAHVLDSRWQPMSRTGAG